MYPLLLLLLLGNNIVNYSVCQVYSSRGSKSERINAIHGRQCYLKSKGQVIIYVACLSVLYLLFITKCVNIIPRRRPPGTAGAFPLSRPSNWHSWSTNHPPSTLSWHLNLLSNSFLMRPVCSWFQAEVLKFVQVRISWLFLLRLFSMFTSSSSWSFSSSSMPVFDNINIIRLHTITVQWVNETDNSSLLYPHDF